MKTVVLNNEKFTITNALYESIMENSPSLLTEAPRKKRLNNKVQDEDNVKKVEKIKKQSKKSDELAKKNKSAKQKGAENILKQQAKRNGNMSNGILDLFDKKMQQEINKISNKSQNNKNKEENKEVSNIDKKSDEDKYINKFEKTTDDDTASLLAKKPHFLGKWNPKNNVVTNAYKDDDKEEIKNKVSNIFSDFKEKAEQEDIDLENFSESEKKICDHILLLIAKEAIAYKSIECYNKGLNNLINASKDTSDSRINKLLTYYAQLKNKFDQSDGSLTSYNINFNNNDGDDLFKQKSNNKSNNKSQNKSQNKQYKLDFDDKNIKESKEITEAQITNNDNIAKEISNMKAVNKETVTNSMLETNSLPEPSAKLKDCYFEVSEEGPYNGVVYEVNSGIICREVRDADDTENGVVYEWQKISVPEYLVKYDPFIEYYLKDIVANSYGIIKRIKHVIHSMIGILGSSSLSSNSGKKNHFEKDELAVKPQDTNNEENTDNTPYIHNNTNINYDITESKSNKMKKLTEADAVSSNIKLMLSGFKITPMNINPDNMGIAFKNYVTSMEDKANTPQNKKINSMIRAVLDIINNEKDNDNIDTPNEEKYETKLKQIMADFLSAICFRMYINNDNEYHMIMRVIRDDNVLNSHFGIQYLNTQQQFNVLDTVMTFKRKTKNDTCAIIFAKPLFAKGSKILNNFKPLVDKISSLEA